MSYNSFNTMPVWILASDIASEVYKLTGRLPKSEDYALSGQLGRAAVSIAGNIAEGFGRAHTKEKIHFYSYSRGSAFETISHLLIGKKVNYFSEDEVQPILNKCLKVIEELNKITKVLNKGYT